MKRVLIIDDDLSISDLLCDFLSSSGYGVRSFTSAQQALNFMKEEPPFHVILLDLMMPEMDGQALRQQQLKIASWSHVPVVLMSAAAHAKEKLRHVGAVAFLNKPFEITEILRVIRTYSLE
jgi:DNA-binding response OmpR family regulator